jgi:hypothetical protein
VGQSRLKCFASALQDFPSTCSRLRQSLSWARKVLVGRPRPPGTLGECLSNNSFRLSWLSALVALNGCQGRVNPGPTTPPLPPDVPWTAPHLSAASDGSSDPTPADFQILSFSWERLAGEESVRVHGEVRNGHPLCSAGVELQAIGLNASGTSVATNGFWPAESQSIAPGAATPFTVAFRFSSEATSLQLRAIDVAYFPPPSRGRGRPLPTCAQLRVRQET